MKQLEQAPPRGSASRPAAEPPPPYREPWLGAAAAAFGVWLLYFVTLAPTTQFWDTSEYIATAHIMGIPHPPGNPLFVVLARAWDLLLQPTGLSVAVRINLFSATMSALAHGFWFLIAHRILAYYSQDRWFRIVGASAAVLISAAAFTVWNQSNVNEKVYTVTLFTIALLSWLAFRWRDHVGEGKDDNLILLMVFILALSVGNHLMAFLAAPALGLYILLIHPRTLLNWRLYVTGLLAIVLGLSIHLFLPIRAGLDPIINEADPTCASMVGAVQSVLTMGATGCTELSESLQRQQYSKPSMFSDPTAPYDMPRPRGAGLLFAQVMNYVQYFDWQWARSANGNTSWFGGLRPLFTLLFATLGVFGAWTHWQRDRTSFAYIAVLFVTLSMGLVFYLNFKYGYSYPLRGSFQELREVRERDYFFIVSFSVWGVWAGIGLAALWQALAEWFRERNPSLERPLASASPVMVLAVLPLMLNWSWASRADDYTARDWAYNLLMSLEPYAIVFTNGDNDTFPLWYLQEVEGLRRDVTVMVGSYLNTPWYVKQIRELTRPCQPGEDPLADPTRIVCQRPFEPDQAPQFYADMLVPLDQPGLTADMLPPGRRPPTRSIMPYDDAQIDQIANSGATPVTQQSVYSAGNIRTVIEAGPNAWLQPADVFMAQMVQTAIDDRPIYFAMTTAMYESLNLDSFLVRQGVAYKLSNGPVVPDSMPGVYAVPGQMGQSRMVGPYIDLPRTERLLDEVFLHRGDFPNWSRWVDSATEGIPFYYAFTHFGMASVYSALGDTVQALNHQNLGDTFLRLAQLREQ